MTALYWTKTGKDIWKLSEEKFFVLKNMETQEYTVAQNISELSEFEPVNMPVINKPAQKKKRTPQKAAKADRKKSKYKGVSRIGKKWRAQIHDKIKNKNIHLGVFVSELLAAAAYQEYIGNTKEAKRLRNEYEEGDRMPEPPDYSKEQPDTVNVKVTGGQQAGDIYG